MGELLDDANSQGASELVLNTANIENVTLLDAVEKMSLEAMPKSMARVDALVSFYGPSDV
jgi:hypothetical protein